MLREWPAFHALAKTFAEGPVCLRIAGLTGAARALAVAELVQAHPRPAVVLVESVPDAHRWSQDLKFFGAPALEFPEPEPRLWRGGRQREADAELLVLPLPTQGDGARLARLTDYVPVAAPIVVDAPRVLDATREDAPASPPLRERLFGRQLVELSLVAGTSSAFAGPLPEAVEVTLETQAVPQFGGRFAQLAGELGRWRLEGFRIRLVASDARQVEHLRQFLR